MRGRPGFGVMRAAGFGVRGTGPQPWRAATAGSIQYVFVRGARAGSTHGGGMKFGPAAFVTAYLPVALVDDCVMLLAEQAPVALRGGAEISFPPEDMVRVAPVGGHVAPRERTPAISRDDGAADPRREQPRGPPLVQHHGFGVQDLRNDLGVACQETRGCRRDRAGVVRPCRSDDPEEVVQRNRDHDLWSHAAVDRAAPGSEVAVQYLTQRLRVPQRRRAGIRGPIIEFAGLGQRLEGVPQGLGGQRVEHPADRGQAVAATQADVQLLPIDRIPAVEGAVGVKGLAELFADPAQPDRVAEAGLRQHQFLAQCAQLRVDVGGYGGHGVGDRGGMLLADRASVQSVQQLGQGRLDDLSGRGFRRQRGLGNADPRAGLTDRDVQALLQERRGALGAQGVRRGAFHEFSGQANRDAGEHPAGALHLAGQVEHLRLGYAPELHRAELRHVGGDGRQRFQTAVGLASRRRRIHHRTHSNGRRLLNRRRAYPGRRRRTVVGRLQFWHGQGLSQSSDRVLRTYDRHGSIGRAAVRRRFVHPPGARSPGAPRAARTATSAPPGPE